MINVNVGLAGKPLPVNVGLLERQVTLWGLQWGRQEKREMNFQSWRLSCGLYFLLYSHCNAYLLLGLINFSLMPR